MCVCAGVCVCVANAMITGSPAGLSRVNGDGPSSAKVVHSTASQSHNYESFVFKFGKGDNVTQISNPAKFGWDRMSGGAPRSGKISGSCAFYYLFFCFFLS